MVLASRKQYIVMETDLCKQCVQTMNLLLLFNVGIILSDSLQRELCHQINGERVPQMLLLHRRIIHHQDTPTIIICMLPYVTGFTKTDQIVTRIEIQIKA